MKWTFVLYFSGFFFLSGNIHLIYSQGGGNGTEVLILPAEEFNTASAVAPCLNKRGEDGCYLVYLKVPDNYQISYSNGTRSGYSFSQRFLFNMERNDDYYTITIPSTGAEVDIKETANEKILHSHIFPPDRAGGTLYYRVQINKRRTDVKPTGLLVDRRLRGQVSDTNKSPTSNRSMESVNTTQIQDENNNDPDVEQGFYVFVDEMPTLLGGLEGLYKKIKYPEEARRNAIEGRVYVQFIINEQGNVVDPEVIRGIGGGADKEALRVVKQAKFKPGMLHGKPVRVQYSLPIIFRLKD